MSHTGSSPLSSASRFVPVDPERLQRDLFADAGLDSAERGARERVLRRHAALFDHRLVRELRRLKAHYLPFNPDLEAVPPPALASGERAGLHAGFRARVAQLLQAANFDELSEEDFNSALNRTSPRGVRVEVDFASFEEVAVFFRGVAELSVEKRSARHLYLKKKSVPYPTYRRLFLLVKMRRRGDGSETPILLKLFRDVPRSDLEMLLPNTRVRMTSIDKLKLGVTGGGGTLGGVVAMVGKIGVAANPATWAIALVGLAAVLWRQVSKVFVQRTRYMAALAERLYFHSLDTNFGAVSQLVETAGEEEWKEAALAWHFLLESGADGLDHDELDRRVETWITERYGQTVDFDVRDGVRKLLEDGLVESGCGTRLVAVAPEESFRRLDAIWDSLFRASQPVAARMPGGPAL
ncbi:MAG TPA: DUF3754 domain-containing protein [Planctomycetota bacterium]